MKFSFFKVKCFKYYSIKKEKAYKKKAKLLIIKEIYAKLDKSHLVL